MRVLSPAIAVFLLLFLGLPGWGQSPAPLPSDFDSSAPLPKNITLPAKMNVPPNSHIEVTAWTKGVDPSKPPDLKNMSLLWNPHLLSAVIESDDQNAHATFQWEGGRTSEAFLIRGECFRLTCLAYPQIVTITSSGLDFWVARENPTEGDNGNFPDASWYIPAAFAGTASFNGKKVLVFTPGEKKPGSPQPSADDNYPTGVSLCLDPTTLSPVWLNDGASTYTFTYLPAHNVQINPQGYYLKAIVAKFGHYP